MNFEEINNIWKNAEQNLNLENAPKINKDLLKELSTYEIKSRLFEMKWSSILEIILNIPFFIFFLGFFIDHFFDFKFALPALFLVLWSAASLFYSGYKINLFLRINTRYSIVQAQKTLETLRYMEAGQVNLLYVIIPLFSFPFMVVLIKALLGLSFYQFLGAWFVYYTLGSALIAVLLVYLLKKFPNKNLKDSLAFLEHIREMEQQE